MKIHISALCISICICNILYAGHIVVQRDYTIEYNIEEHDQKPIVFYFNQECTVDNAQSNACTHHSPQTLPSITEHESKITSWCSFNDLFTPFKVGIAVCLIGGLYVLKAKMTLYGLSKACFQNAFWSLWQTKSAIGITEDHNPETELLHDILKTYQTDQYALAIARFLQDIDKEMGQLSSYLKQAKRTNSSMIYFFLPDLSDDITEIESRLTKLACLKQKVLNWLAYSNGQMRTIRWPGES